MLKRYNIEVWTKSIGLINTTIIFLEIIAFYHIYEVLIKCDFICFFCSELVWGSTNYILLAETNPLEVSALQNIMQLGRAKKKVYKIALNNKEMEKSMKKIEIIKNNDKRYPSKLLKIKNAPKQLYVLGNISLLNKKSIAIIGSRDCTLYGYEQATHFSKQLAQEDICIVSGMALGIDSAAHIGAKSEVGKTIAVLGSGFNNIFPEENNELFNQILENGGCIITEYAPDVEPSYNNFPSRNRIVSGLSDGVLVVEARYRSGTSITAKYAKQQGKKVFCIPSNLNTTTGVGTGRLIQKGAKLVLSPEDIMIELGIREKQNDIDIEDVEIQVNAEYKDVYDSLSKMPSNVNEICKKTNKTIIEVNTTLTMLELEGLVKQVGANQFAKVR